VFDGAQAGGYPGFAGGDGLAVALAVGAFGQVAAEAFDFADVGFSLVGVSVLPGVEDSDEGGVRGADVGVWEAPQPGWLRGCGGVGAGGCG
jgi:hypothetical protein